MQTVLDAAGDLAVQIEPLRFARRDLDRLIDEIAAGLGAGARRSERVASLGWPYVLVEADGQAAAIYRFLTHVGVVRVQAPRARRDDVLRLLDSARPDWSGPDVIALAQLWER
jgi:hypothetical protein